MSKSIEDIEKDLYHARFNHFVNSLQELHAQYNEEVENYEENGEEDFAIWLSMELMRIKREGLRE